MADGQRPEIETPLPDQLGGKTGKRGGIEDLQRSLGRYGNAKSATLALLRDLGESQASGLGLRVPRIRECGDWLKFRDYYQRDVVKLVASNFCRNHLACGLCAIRRGARGLAVYIEKAESVPGFGDYIRPAMVTTTVRNGEDLRERLGHLLRNYRELLKRRHRDRDSVMRGVLGGVYSVEVTNTGNGWHPHIHAIWLCRRDAVVGELDLRREWEALTGDSFECDVSAMRPRLDLGEGVSPYAADFCEVFKYATKPVELGAALFAEAYPVLRSRRLLASFGCLRGVVVPESLADDVRGFEDEPYLEFLARFVAGGYRLSSSGEVCNAG